MSEKTNQASIVVCVYNRADQVVTCLESLLRLDLADFEIVLVDDGSTDETPAQLAAFRAAHPARPITVVTNPRNLGISGARNAGIRAARGENVLFTDSDCVVEPGWLRAMLAELARPGVGAVAGLVRDAAPRNYVERAYVGWTRVPDSADRVRLVGNNMGFPRGLACRYLFDPALSYYCDETDIERRLRDDGYSIAFARDAVVNHDHPMNWRKYLRMGFMHGQGSARFWYKHRMLGRDPWPLVALLLTLPLAFFGWPWAAVPLACLAMQVALVIANEMIYKGKGLGRTLYSLPVALAYNVARTVGVFSTWLGLLFGREQALRESKRQWQNRGRTEPCAQSASAVAEHRPK
jgi:glycosyltransferase involved in cell wall biosynthesis